jgi:hypothetical protein
MTCFQWVTAQCFELCKLFLNREILYCYVLWKLFSNRDLLGIVIGVSMTTVSVCAVSEDLSLVSFCTTFPRLGCVGDILTSVHFPPAVGSLKKKMDCQKM